MSLTKRFRAAFTAFKTGGLPVATVTIGVETELEKMLLDKRARQEEAIGLLPALARFIAIKAVNRKEEPYPEDIDVLADGLRAIHDATIRTDAIKAVTEAVPRLLLHHSFKQLVSDPTVVAILRTRYGQ